MDELEQRFNGLFAPASCRDFLTHHRRREPWLVARDSPEIYDALISKEQVRDLIGIVGRLAETQPEAQPVMQLIGGELAAGEVRLRSPTSSTPKILDAYRSGSSLLIPSVHRYWRPLQVLCDELEQLLLSPVNTTFIQTPQNAQAFGRHFDVADSIVLHLGGEKRWRVFDSGADCPLEGVPRLPFESAPEMVHHLRDTGRREVVVDPKILIETTLRAGDLLYVPRGFDHDVWTTSSTAIHITISVQPVTYVDVLLASVRRFAERSNAIRQRLEPSPWTPDVRAEMHNKSEQLLAEFVSSFSAAEALRDIAETLETRTRERRDFPGVIGDGAVREVELPTDEWVVEHVSDSKGKVSIGAGFAVLSYGERKFSLPSATYNALVFIAGRKRFAVHEIPGLTGASRIALCGRLLRAHVLRRTESMDVSDSTVGTSGVSNEQSA